MGLFVGGGAAAAGTAAAASATAAGVSAATLGTATALGAGDVALGATSLGLAVPTATAAAGGLSTLGYASLASGAIGAVTSTVGAINSANAQGAAAAYSAQVAKNNATIAGQNAEEATQAGEAKAESQGLQNRAKLAAIVTGQAASGTDVNSGSNKQVAESQSELNQLDSDTTINNAALQAYGYRSQATSFQAQSALDTSTADQASEAAALGGASSLFSSASNLGFNTSKFTTKGVI